jgi:hypothetical protein
MDNEPRRFQEALDRAREVLRRLEEATDLAHRLVAEAKRIAANPPPMKGKRAKKTSEKCEGGASE